MIALTQPQQSNPEFVGGLAASSHFRIDRLRASSEREAGATGGYRSPDVDTARAQPLAASMAMPARATVPCHSFP